MTTRIHRPHVGMIRFTLLERIMLLFRGTLYFVTRKPNVEIQWTVNAPREIKAPKGKSNG